MDDDIEVIKGDALEEIRFGIREYVSESARF